MGEMEGGSGRVSSTSGVRMLQREVRAWGGARGCGIERIRRVLGLARGEAAPRKPF